MNTFSHLRLARAVMAAAMAMPLLAGSVAAADLPPSMQNIQSKGVTLVPLPPAMGVSGWLGSKDNKLQVFYVTPNGEGVIAGVLYDKDGRDVTAQQLADLFRAQSAAPADFLAKPTSAASPIVKTSDVEDPTPLLADVARTKWFGIGRADAPPLYMVADVNCSVCREAFTRLEPLVDAGKVHLRVMLVVAQEGNNGLMRTAAVLASSDPAGAYRQNERFYKNGAGGLPPMAENQPMPPAVVEAINANHAFIKAHPVVKRTPFFIFKDRNGARVVDGLPDDLAAVVGSLRP